MQKNKNGRNEKMFFAEVVLKFFTIIKKHHVYDLSTATLHLFRLGTKTMHSPRSCVVLGCIQKDRTVSRRVFPNFNSNPELFREWVVATGNPKLLNFSTDYIRRNFRVCDKHFPMEIAAMCSHLPRNCIPTLHIPGLSVD